MKRAKRSSDKPRASAVDSDDRLPYLAAALAHEVRNPLNAMAIHLELLETRARKLAPSEGEAITRSLGVLAHEVERIDGILVQYLAAVGPREAERKQEPAARLLEEAAARAKAQAAARHVEVAVSLARGPARWAIDSRAVARVLDEVLANAIEASPRGGEVALRARVDEGIAVVEVEDRGEGVAAEVLPRIFHLGFTTRKGRPGLGLAVAKQIVKGHGGSISARSEGAGRGTTVRFEIPLD